MKTKKLKYYYLATLLAMAPAFASDDEASDDNNATKPVVQEEVAATSSIALPGQGSSYKAPVAGIYSKVDLSGQSEVPSFFFELDEENQLKKLKGELKRNFNKGLHHFVSIFYHDAEHRHMAIDMLASFPPLFQYKILLSAGPEFLSDFLKSIDNNTVTTWAPNVSKYHNLQHSKQTGALAIIRMMFGQLPNDSVLVNALAQYFCDEVFASWTSEEINDVLIAPKFYDIYKVKDAKADKKEKNSINYKSVCGAMNSKGTGIVRKDKWASSLELITYGPYVNLESGLYTVTLEYSKEGLGDLLPEELLELDVIYQSSSSGYSYEKTLKAKAPIQAAVDPSNDQLFTYSFEIEVPQDTYAYNLEVRTYAKYSDAQSFALESIKIKRKSACEYGQRHENFAANPEGPTLSEEECAKETWEKAWSGRRVYSDKYNENKCGNERSLEVDTALPVEFLRPILLQFISSNLRLDSDEVDAHDSLAEDEAEETQEQSEKASQKQVVQIESQREKAINLMAQIYASKGMPEAVFSEFELCKAIDSKNLYAYLDKDVLNSVFELCEPHMFEPGASDEEEDWFAGDDNVLALTSGKEDII